MVGDGGLIFSYFFQILFFVSQYEMIYHFILVCDRLSHIYANFFEIELLLTLVQS